MPTTNPRVNVTFEPAIAAILTELAEAQQKSVASLSKELICEALERHEDMALSALAELRDIKNAKMIKHEDAWK